MDLPAAPFSSCLGSPVLFLIVHVRDGLPLLGDRQTTAILRDTWLRSVGRDQWLVGPYLVLPDQVRMLVCAGRSAGSLAAWTGNWKASAAVRIKRIIGGHGRLWESGATGEPVASAAEYEARCEVLGAVPAGPDHGGTFCPSGQAGMLWQILPAGSPVFSSAPAR